MYGQFDEAKSLVLEGVAVEGSLGGRAGGARSPPNCSPGTRRSPPADLSTSARRRIHLATITPGSQLLTEPRITGWVLGANVGKAGLVWAAGGLVGRQDSPLALPPFPGTEHHPSAPGGFKMLKHLQN